MPLSLDKIEPAYFYEINPAKLTRKYPDHLKQIQFLTVSEKTESSITVRYPSMSSLRTHFNRGQNTRRNTKNIWPAFNETYEMDVGLAGEVFVKKITGLDQIKGVLSFWSSLSDCVVSKKGSLWSELKSSDMVHWGKRKARNLSSRRRKVNNKYDPLWLPSNDRDEDEDDQMDLEEGGGGEGDEGSERGLLSQKNGKRKENDNNMETITQTNKKARSGDEPRRNQATSGGKTTKIIKNSTSRWSEDRYKAAEKNILMFMKEKGAVLSNPILRRELRDEARKFIGDTGFLDHLLKRIAGKLAPGGEERFQRGHNADGGIEYWLENADLTNIRKEAGIQDPYWIPPADWQPGDCPSQDPVCARKIKKLEERVDELERLVKELRSEKQERHEDQCLKHSGLVQKKATIQQLKEISESLDGIVVQEVVFSSAVETSFIKSSSQDNTVPSIKEPEKDEHLWNNEKLFMCTEYTDGNNNKGTASPDAKAAKMQEGGNLPVALKPMGKTNPTRTWP